MSFVRRKEYAAVTSIMFFLILYLMVNCGAEDVVAIDPVDSVIYTPEVQPQYTPAVYPQPVQPYRPQVEPYRPCRPSGRWQRPDYTPRQPLRNILRFLFTPRWRSC